VCNFTAKCTKRLVKKWRRYSSSKICKNESNQNHVIAESHEKDSNFSQYTFDWQSVCFGHWLLQYGSFAAL